MITLTILFALTILGTVSAADGDTNLAVNSASGSQGQQVDLSATLTGDTLWGGGWEPLNNRDVDFYVDGAYVNDDNTNSNGYAHVTYNIPASATPGTHAISAHYAGNMYYDEVWGYGTLTVTVPDINPNAVNDVASVNEDGTLNGDVSTNDNRGNTPSTFSVVTGPTHGTLNLNTATGTYTYTPTANYNGADSFTYRITDNDGDTDTATVSITINPIDDYPDAVNDGVSINEDGTLNGNAATNDVPSGDGGNVWSITVNPTHGTVTMSNTGSYTYTPSANYNGSDSFTYRIRDGDGDIDTATVSITVTPVNDNPVAQNDAATTNEDTPVTINAGANDTDVDGDTLTYSGHTYPSNGSVIPSGAYGDFIYTPNPNWYGTDSFTYIMGDGKGGFTGWTTVTITVNPVNDAPVANDDTATTNEDTSVIVDVLANDTDVEGNPLIVIDVKPPSNGGVTLIGGVVTYIPNPNWYGTATFEYTIFDYNGGLATGTVTVTVNPVNDAPVANDDSATGDEDGNSIIDVKGNDSDIDGDPLNVINVSDPANGSTTINGDGTITYTPDANWFGSETFTYTISDGNGGTATATVTMTINSVNDAPVATGDSQTTDEDTPVNGAVTATDVENDPLTFTEGTGPTNGTVIVNADGTYTYTPNANFNGDDSFTVIVSDGNGGTDEVTVYITVTPVNDAPVAVDNNVSTPEDTASGYDVLGNDYDVDGDSLTITGVTQPTNGVVVNYGTYVEYTPNSNYNGPDQFTYTIIDGNGGTATATVYVTVNPVNDAPVAVDGSATTKEDTPVSGSLAGTDIDGDSLTFAKGTGPSNGTVIVNADGTYTYTPNTNYYGSDSFTFIVNDGNGGTDEGTVSITVERAVASVYVLTTVSKNNPNVGETITITFKLGNKGPDPADDVVFTYKIPEGMEFVSLETEPGYPAAVYDPATRTITWALGTVPVLDPWLKVNVKVLKAGSFNINPTVTTSTYDPTLGTSVQSATVNAVNVANAASNTVPMQPTGVPLVGFVLAVLMLTAGLVIPKRK